MISKNVATRSARREACGGSCSRLAEGEIIVVKLLRACGGCLGARRLKGVEGCEKSGGVVKQALIPEFPSESKLTQGTETSKYLEEEKETSIPRVVASEKGTA
jgi:hypothetical protein